MIILALTAAALLIALAALTVALLDRRRRRRNVRRNGHDVFVAWDWPTRPVNGHDHPEPPELLQEGEPAA